MHCIGYNGGVPAPADSATEQVGLMGPSRPLRLDQQAQTHIGSTQRTANNARSSCTRGSIAKSAPEIAPANSCPCDDSRMATALGSAPVTCCQRCGKSASRLMSATAQDRAPTRPMLRISARPSLGLTAARPGKRRPRENPPCRPRSRWWHPRKTQLRRQAEAAAPRQRASLRHKALQRG
jgi:hypothetical protein